MPFRPAVKALAHYWLSSASHAPLSVTEREAVDRLVTWQDMDPVWETIASDPNDYVLPDSFLQCCIYSRRRWSRLSKIPDKTLLRQMNEIADQADQLAQLFKDRRREIQLIELLPLTVERLLRQEFPEYWRQATGGANTSREADQLTERPPTQVSTSTALEVPQFDDDEALEAWLAANPEIEPLGELPLDVFLARLGTLLRRPMCSTESLIRPTRVNANNAERTFLQREITHFFMTHGGKPQPELVARTVSAILDLDPPLDADLVKRNVEDISNWEWGPSEDYEEGPDE